MLVIVTNTQKGVFSVSGLHFPFGETALTSKKDIEAWQKVKNSPGMKEVMKSGRLKDRVINTTSKAPEKTVTGKGSDRQNAETDTKALESKKDTEERQDVKKG